MSESKAENSESPRLTSRQSHVLALIPLGIALNLSLGALVHAVKIPLYMDSVGTIAITLLAGLRAGIYVGVGSFLLGGILVNPVLPWFSGTQATIAVYIYTVARLGAFRSNVHTIAAGIGLGVVASVVSAPVIVSLFGGITGNGVSLIVAFLLSSGKTIMESVVLSGLAAEPFDKTVQCLLAVWLLRGMPQSLLQQFPGQYLHKNNLLNRDRK